MNTPGPNPQQRGYTSQLFHRDRLPSATSSSEFWPRLKSASLLLAPRGSRSPGPAGRHLSRARMAAPGRTDRRECHRVAAVFRAAKCV